MADMNITLDNLVGPNGLTVSNTDGALTVTVTGEVNVTGGNGISASTSGTDLTVMIKEGVRITAPNTGIEAVNTGSGALMIISNGNVIGFSTGIFASTKNNARVDIAGPVEGIFGTAIDMTNVAGDATLALRSGWSLRGQALGSSTSNDTLTLTGDKAATLDLTQVGDDDRDNAILGFEKFVMDASADWTLSGAQGGDGFATAELREGRLILADTAVFKIADGGTFTIGKDGGTATLNIGAAIGEAAAAPGTLEAETVTFGSGVGTLNFNHTGSSYIFAPVISGPGTVNVTSGTTILTGTNSYTGGTIITAGTLQVGDGGISGDLGTGNVENGGTLAFNRSDALSYAGSISGTGALQQLGTGTTILTGDSKTFTGNTTVDDGTLRVNGVLGGTLNVNNGGILGGAGTVGTTTVGAGGILSPGNSPGTLTIDGDLTLNAGAVYEVELGDLIVVTGAAALGGEVRVADDAWRGGVDYTILTADGGVTGTFEGTTFAGARSDFTFLDALLGYSATAVTLRLERNDIAFDSVATTSNQKGVAGGLDSLSFGNPLYDAVVMLDGSGARQAFDQLSGEAHASGISALASSSDSIRGILSQRFQAAFGNRQAVSPFPLTSYASFQSAAEQEATGGNGAWGEVFGSWGQTDGNGDAAGLRHDEGGFLAGADGMLGESTSIGVFAGYSRSTFSARDRNSSGSSDNIHLGIHGGTQIGALRLNMGASHSWHAIETRRSVAFPGFSDSLSASYQGRTAQVFGEAGYRFGTHAFSFEPFAGLAHVHTRTNRFTETGGAAALTAQRSTTATSFSTLGLRAFSEFEMGGMPARARGMVGWRHAFGDTTPAMRMAFAGGDGFSVSGTPIARDMAILEAGLDLGMSENATVKLSYDGEFSRRTQRHGVNARLQVAF